MPGEFEIIKRYFSFSPSAQDDVLLGIGDDAAIVQGSAAPLVVATDTLVEGVHFFKGTDARDIATRALGVNLSDFAAMGAIPRWYTLSLVLPESDEKWLQGFSDALACASAKYDVALVGGDTCRGPLTVSLTLIGESAELPLKRSGAKPGEDVWVSGVLGLGAGALALQTASDRNDIFALSDTDHGRMMQHFFSPEPQLALGQSLLTIASAAIDISDGLLADAAHIAKQSEVAIQLQQAALPLPLFDGEPIATAQLLDWALGGDDYQLLFTAAEDRRDELAGLSESLGVKLTRIGEVLSRERDPDRVTLLDASGSKINCSARGYQHF